MENDNQENEEDPTSDDVVPMIVCSDCGHLVPEPNLVLHQATACRGRARRAASPSPEAPLGAVAAAAINVDDDDDSLSHQEDQKQRSSAKRKSQESDDKEVIDLVASPDQEEATTHWACPRCTLLNPHSTLMCEACQYHNDRSARAPDPTRREALLHPDMNSPSSMVGGGALLGSMLGAAGAYMRGRSVTNGALDGALSGAVGGAVFSQLIDSPADPAHSPPPPPTYAADPPHSHYRTRSSTTTTTPRRRRAQPRSSFRVVQQSNHSHEGMMQTVVYSSPTTAQSPEDLMRFMMRSQHMVQVPNIDAMSYEQMLHMFGDGSENRGANEGDISALPSSTVQGDLPEDQRQCSICLEHFKQGDKRKVLPCLHGFHETCVDKWLRTNGSCPVCKHKIT